MNPRPAADAPAMAPTQDDGAGTKPGDEHPLQRAHRFFQRAAPVIRDAQDAIERHGGIEGVRDVVIERANELVQKVDEAVANATAIEGTVIERDEPDPAATASTPRSRPARHRRRRLHYVELGIIVAAATYGALALQRRTVTPR